MNIGTSILATYLFVWACIFTFSSTIRENFGTMAAEVVYGYQTEMAKHQKP